VLRGDLELAWRSWPVFSWRQQAEKYDVPPIAIATAWITRHPAQWQVVIGTTTPEWIAAAAQGSEVPLTRSEWYEMFRAAGYAVP